MGPWMSLVRPWTGPTGCSRFGRSKRPQQVHVLFAQQKEVLAQRPVTRKKRRHIHSTQRICLGSRPLSSCLDMKCDETWWNVMKINETSGDFWEKVCHDLTHVSTFSEHLWALHPEARSFKLLPSLHNRLHLLYLRNTEHYCMQRILHIMIYIDLWWIIMNQWIMNLCLPLIGQPLEAKLLLGECSRTVAPALMPCSPVWARSAGRRVLTWKSKPSLGWPQGVHVWGHGGWHRWHRMTQINLTDYW